MTDVSKGTHHQTAFEIQKDSEGPFFVFQDGKKKIQVRPEFRKRENIGGRADLLAKAIGYKDHLKKFQRPLYILDATAGLCRDSFHFRCLGCEVTAIEENKLIFDVVSEYVKSLDADLKFQLTHATAVEHFKSLEDSQRPDVIYIDPMFPDTKSTAKAGKESQLLQLVAKPADLYADRELLEQAVKVARRRVVVKRPSHAEVLAELKGHQRVIFEGKSIRYDVYMIGSNP